MRIILVLMVIVIGAFALSDEMRFDMLKAKVVEQVKNGDHKGTLETIFDLRRMNRKLPVSIYYYQGKAYVATGQYRLALQVLEEYLSQAGKKGKYYNEALALYAVAEEKYNLPYLTTEHYMFQDNEEMGTLRLTYQQARKYCDRLSLGGFTNWRIPQFWEMEEYIKNKDKTKHLNSHGIWWTDSNIKEKCNKHGEKCRDVAMTIDTWGNSDWERIGFDWPVRCVRNLSK